MTVDERAPQSSRDNHRGDETQLPLDAQPGAQVWVRDEASPDGVRRGELIHRGSDGNLLVLWADEAGMAVMPPSRLIPKWTPASKV
jgi:hypothetical protein